MTFDAGSAVGTYKLDISDARRAANELRALFGGIRRDAQAIGGGAQGLRQVTDQEVKLAQALARTAAAEARKAAEANKAIQINQRQLKSNADLALSEQRKQTEIARTAAAQDRAAVAALRRQQAEERAARGSSGGGTLSRLQGAAGTALGGLGIGLGAGAAISGGLSAGREALQARQTANALSIAAGEQGRFNEAVAIARRNQLLFGGTLQENQAALIGLANISRQTGIALGTIDSVVNQLKAADPAATFEDAQIALREFASGDVTSIAERFELPRKALNAIIQSTPDAATRIKLLSDLLTQQGYSAATAASAIDQTQISYNLLGAVVDRFTVQAGSSLANFFRESAEGLAVLISYLSAAGTSLDTFTRLLSEGVPIQEASARATEAGRAAFEDALNVNLASIPVTDATTNATNTNTAARLANADATNQQTAAELAHQAGLARLRNQAANTQNLVAGNQELGGPGRTGNDLADFDAELERRAAVEEAQKRQIVALETTAQRVARLRAEEAAATDGSAEQIDLTTERIQAERQLADQQESAALKTERAGQRGLKSQATLVRQEATLFDQRAERQQQFLAKLLQDQEEYQRRSARSLEDFELGKARDTEDFERERRRLLAEGRRFEADQLTQEFQREQRREQEDFDRNRLREREDLAIQQQRGAADVGLNLGDQALLRGVRLPPASIPGAVPSVTPASGTPITLPEAGAISRPTPPGRSVQLIINMDGRQVATAIIDDIDDLLTAGAVQADIFSPARPPNQAVAAGGRP